MGVGGYEMSLFYSIFIFYLSMRTEGLNIAHSVAREKRKGEGCKIRVAR
jgi:hypothetical protein